MGRNDFLAGAMEGSPGIEEVLEKLRFRQISRVKLIPLLNTVGYHAANDLAGDAPESWKNRIMERGYAVKVSMKGLGEYAGIDHSLAALDLRERFSFTKTLAAETMKMLKSTGGAAGCVILSTCNRTEFWLSGAGDADPAALLCELKGQSPELRQYLTVRRGEDAVRHLMQTACGMNSQLFGEDQIVTQVGDAGGLARECGGSDPILDTLFRMAVTAAKRVKTEVPLTEVRRSAAESALELLEKALGSLTGRSALECAGDWKWCDGSADSGAAFGKRRRGDDDAAQLPKRRSVCSKRLPNSSVYAEVFCNGDGRYDRQRNSKPAFYHSERGCRAAFLSESSVC